MESNGYTQADSLLELPHINRDQLAAMADAAVSDHNEFETSAPSSPSSKRKRGPDSSPDSRRAKRNTTVTNMSGTPDPSAYVESAVEAAQAAAQAANVNADFSALQQATADSHESADPSNASSTAAAALGVHGTMYPTLHVPPSTEETFAQQPTTDTGHHQDSSFDTNDMVHPDGLSDPSSASLPQPPTQNGSTPSHSPYTTTQASKPVVGSEEWHKMRKDSHKEVERRRRETINEGINELSKIVPGCEKNKGSILQRAVNFITQLKENEAQNLEKWTLEKLLTEQAIAELGHSNEKLKNDRDRTYNELVMWKQLAQDAGLSLPRSKEDPPASS